jgi:hypothetical protein
MHWVTMLTIATTPVHSSATALVMDRARRTMQVCRLWIHDGAVQGEGEGRGGAVRRGVVISMHLD